MLLYKHILKNRRKQFYIYLEGFYTAYRVQRKFETCLLKVKLHYVYFYFFSLETNIKIFRGNLLENLFHALPHAS